MSETLGEQPTRLCKNCEYFEDWHGWPRGYCDHPTHEVAVEVDKNGTCEKFEPTRAREDRKEAS